MEAIKSSAWEVIHSSKNDCWRTPPKLFGSLDNEFSFELDAAATEENKLCQNYLSPLEDALGRSWDAPGAVFCNPPYGRDVGKWVEKAWQESRKRKEPIVLLVMACTDTVWWHDHAWKADEIRLLRGRVHFLKADGGKAAAAPKGSAILVFRGHVPPDGWPGGPRIVSWTTK
jgi:phage N-6-adenine-methyltransferase